MSIDLSKTQSASFLKGLQDLGTVDVTKNLGTVTIGANSNNTLTPIVIPFGRTDVISAIRVNITGTTYIGSYWFPLFGYTLIQDMALGFGGSTPNYCFTITEQSNSGGRQLTLQFINNTGAGVTTPNLTINIHAHLYEFPWA